MRTLLVVGTRKGCFVLESEDRRDWAIRGPYCEGWPVYHAVLEPSSGAIYAAAASEWHGSAVWRSGDFGETWTHSSEGLTYADGSKKMSKVSTLAVSPERLLVGVEAPGIFESRDSGATWSLKSTLAGQPGSEAWDDPANQPPGHLGLSALMFDQQDDDPLLGDRPGHGPVRDDRRRGDLDTPQPRTARRLAARARGGRLLRSQADPLAGRPRAHVPAEPCGMHRSDDAGASWTEITEGLPTRVRVRRGCAPARPRHLLRRAARPRPRPHHAGRRSSRLAHARRRIELAAPRAGPPARGRLPRRAPGGDGNRRPTTLRASTSARAPGSSSQAPTKARAGRRSRATCRRSRPSRSRSSTDGGRPSPRHADATLRRAAATRRGRRRHRRRRYSTASTSGGPAFATACASRARRSARTSTCTSTRRGRSSTRRSRRASRVDVIAAISGG